MMDIVSTMFLLKSKTEATGKIVSQIINSSEFIEGSISIVDFEAVLRREWLPKGCFDLAAIFKESLPQVQVHSEGIADDDDAYYLILTCFRLHIHYLSCIQKRVDSIISSNTTSTVHGGVTFAPSSFGAYQSRG